MARQHPRPLQQDVTPVQVDNDMSMQADRQRHEEIRKFIQSNRPAIGRLMHGEFEICSLAEAEKLSTMLATHCPDAERASVGIWELLCNAIEHGNYEIDFAEKTALMVSGGYHAELERRAMSPPYSGRSVRVFFRQHARLVRLRVVDQGKGFDFNAFGKGFSASDAPNGRGIAIARQISFSSLNYHGCGNIVEATILR